MFNSKYISIKLIAFNVILISILFIDNTNIVHLLSSVLYINPIIDFYYYKRLRPLA